MSRDIKKQIDNYLNENFNGRYRSHVETKDKGLIISISSEKGSERPRIGKVIDILIEKIDVDEFEIKADYEPSKNKFYIELEGK